MRRQLDALVQLTLVDLAHRALRTGRAPGPGLAAHPLVGPFPDTLLAVEADDLVAAHGIVPPPGAAFGAPALRQPDEMAHARASDAVHATRPRARHHLAFPRQRGVGDLPPGTHGTDPAVVGDPGRVEEHLVEVDLTAQVAERADLHTRLVEIDEEVRQPLALGHVDVGAGQEHGPVRDVRPRGPHLLTGDDPVVAVALGPGREGREVGTGARLAEELAPGLLVADDRREKTKPLLLGPVREQGGGSQVQPERVEPSEVERAELLLDPSGRLRGEIEPAVGARPGRRPPARTCRRRGTTLRTRPWS